MNTLLKRAGNGEKGIKSIRHRTYSLFHDLIKFKHVRKDFILFSVFIIFMWLFVGTSLRDAPRGELQFDATPMYILALVTVGLATVFIVNYNAVVYPAITEAYREVKLQIKYPHLYNSFAKESV